jgi:hypothetical protein
MTQQQSRMPGVDECEMIRARRPDGTVMVAMVWAEPGQTVEEAISAGLGDRVFLGFVHGEKKAQFHRFMQQQGA